MLNKDESRERLLSRPRGGKALLGYKSGWNLDIDKVGELGVSDALSLIGSVLGSTGNLSVVGGRKSGADRPLNLAMSDDAASGDSSRIPCSDGLVDLLGGPSTLGGSVDIRTQFCRL